MRMYRTPVAIVALLIAVLVSPARADKLKGFYSGSGGYSAEVHRVLLIDFAADGSALIQQKWHDKDPQTWHAHWKQDGKIVTLIYEPAKNAPTSASPLPEPLIFTFKHGTLTPTSWDTSTLGVLGPPPLTAFGGNVPQHSSVAACQSLNTLDPTGNCVTWSSNQ